MIRKLSASLFGLLFWLSTALAQIGPLPMGPLPLFGGGSSVTIQYGSTSSSGANATSYSFPGMSLGPAATGRIICAAIATSATAVTFNTVAIGGISATQQVHSTNATAASVGDIWCAVVPTGTTGTVSWNCSATCARGYASTYAIYGSSSITKTASNTGGGASTPYSASLTIASNNVAIGICVTNDGNVPTTWTNMTKDGASDILLETGVFSTAQTSTAGTPTVSCSPSGATAGSLALGAWGP